MPEQTVIDRVAEAGTYAPSGMGRQSAIIVEVTNKAVRDRLSELNAEVMGTKADPSMALPPCSSCWQTEMHRHISMTVRS